MIKLINDYLILIDQSRGTATAGKCPSFQAVTFVTNADLGITPTSFGNWHGLT